MLVHLRRRLVDWRVLSSPPELALARDACRDIAVPLRVAGDVLHRDPQADVVRLPLGEGVDGFIAVCDVERARHSAVLEVAERGVVLVEYPLELVDNSHMERVPLRVFVDAARMPTNASRSQVRRDAFPIADAEQRAQKLLPQLIGELARAAQGGSTRARDAALALLSAVAGGSTWHVDVPSLRGPLRELAQLPLVRNAVGQPRSLTAHWRPEVHIGAKPFDPELAPWLDSVLWSPPQDPVPFVAGRAIDTATRGLARFARRQLRAQKKFLAHEQREARVLSSEKAHVRVPLGIEVEGSVVAQDLFDGLHGEVCVYTEGNRGALVVLLEGRMLERVEFDSPLAFDVVIDSPRVKPDADYRGVKRDAEYKRVERAMRAGLVRALESHGLSRRDADETVIDAQLFRKGYGVLSELGLPVRGPLAAAPAYPKRDATWVSLTDLRKEKVIGYVAPAASATIPPGRTVLTMTVAERNVLVPLIGAKLVPYRRVGPQDVAAMLAIRLTSLGGGALLVREPGLVAALTPSAHPRLELYHVGAEIGDRKYLWHWLPCTIAIDCDAIVPDEDWTQTQDDAGLGARDFATWELALVRAIASAVAGERPAELVTHLPLLLDTRLGRALCEAILRHDPTELLGFELLAKLRAAPILRVLGERDPLSIMQVVERHAGAIPYVEQEAPPAPGFTPLVAPKLIAEAMAKLVVREATPGEAALERHYRLAARKRRVEAHRLQPQRPMTVPSEEHVALATPIGRGLVGFHDGVFEIRVFVEGRPFAIIYPPDADLPLSASIEVDDIHCDEAFEWVSESTSRILAIDVRALIPALCVEIAKHRPFLLGERSPARTLLASAWKCNEEVRKQLAGAPAFLTIQGGHISIDQASQPRLIASVAAWQGDWLGPEPGEAPHALDAPILYVPSVDHELSKIVDKLHTGAVVDVTEDVSRLQSRRRIARGLVPVPRVGWALPGLARSLTAFGDLGKQLGIGEIALVEANSSRAILYKDGVKTDTETLDVMPPVEIAVELAEPVSLNEPVQQLAVELVKQVLATGAADQLPARIQRLLVRAALARRLDRDVLMPLELWSTFLAQLELFGDAWFVTEPTDKLPLDERRRVFYVERNTFELASLSGWQVVDAAKELELDAIARINRMRKPSQSLELRSNYGVLAEVTLAGDGVTSPRGTVAVLSPDATKWRGVWPHAKMHPFDRAEDPCRWPTLAMVDDARLAPDRTWTLPQKNAEWQAVAKELRDASEHALAMVGEVPDVALASLRINNHACADVTALRKAPKSVIRGVLWLIGEPHERVAIQVCEAEGVRSFESEQNLGGKLMVFAPDGLNVDVAIAQLCAQIHGKLLRQLMKADALDTDLVAAHVAHGLFLRTLRATDTRAIEFACFSPRPLDARGLTSLFRSENDVIAIKPGMPADPDPHTIELVDDRSVLARTIIADLGTRVRRQRPQPQPRPAAVDVFDAKSQWPTVKAAAPPPPAPKPVAKPKPPEPPHPLRPLVGALRSRLADLGIGGYRWSIIERTEPMFSYSDEIEVAGDNVRLRALAAAQLANSPLFKAGLDVVIAHLVTVLNVALSQITDANEEHAIGVLLANQPSAGPPRSHRSS